MNNPLVSIIIPTYNRAHLIGETLDSVTAQTYQNWECIIVDDGSTDNTVEVVNNYIKKDARFQLHYRPADRLAGGNAARNYGFEKSKGDYINWFDSDDLMLTNFIKKKVDTILMLKNEVDYVLCGFETFGIDYHVSIVYDVGFLESVLNFFMIKNIIFSTPTFFFKRSIVIKVKFNEYLSRAQDLDFVFRVLKHSSSKGINIKEVLVLVRNHNQTITSNFKRNNKNDLVSELIVWENIFKYLFYNSNMTSAGYALRKYLKTIRRTLENEEYILVVKMINKLEELSILFKIKVYLLVLIHCISSRGIQKYKSLMNEEILRLSK
jgi:glycosyltransferase involved in cell wall biosynthesis